MDTVIITAAALVIGAAVILALRQNASAAPAPDAAAFDSSGQQPDFGSVDTTPTPSDNWSGEVYSAADVAGIPVEGDSQVPSLLDSTISNTMDMAFMTTSTSADAQNPNVRAFLDMIAVSEGTSGPEGYRFMFGYPRNPDRLITSYADHPRQYFSFTAGGRTQKTSAAGRYQFLASTWDDLRAKLRLPDFSPASQDMAAIELVRQRGALNDVRAGRIAAAIAKCAKTWASLPGAGYGQPEQKMATLLTAYAQAGGTTLEA